MKITNPYGRRDPRWPKLKAAVQARTKLQRAALEFAESFAARRRDPLAALDKADELEKAAADLELARLAFAKVRRG